MRVTFEYVLSQSLQENSQKLFEYEDKQNDRQKWQAQDLWSTSRVRPLPVSVELMLQSDQQIAP